MILLVKILWFLVTLTVNDYSKPLFIENTISKLECKASSLNASLLALIIKYEWRKDEKPVNLTVLNAVTTPNGTILEFNNLNKENEGIYKCSITLSTSVLPIQSNNYTIKVETSKIIINSKFQFLRKNY